MPCPLVMKYHRSKGSHGFLTDLHDETAERDLSARFTTEGSRKNEFAYLAAQICR